MKCKNCGGTLDFQNGVAICNVCNTSYKIDHVFEDVDVYICYIESDSSGRRTKDSIVAQEIFRKLESKKINTFYERVSATNIIGDELELLRYSSVRAAKIILVVGTNVDNFKHILEKYGQYISDKTVIPLVADIKPSDIPKELSKIQALDFSSIGWEMDLEKGVLRLLGREKELDILNSNKKSKKLRNIVLGIVIVLFLIAIGIFGFSCLNKSEDPQPPVQQSNQEIYDNAQNLVENESFLEAYDLYSSILEYKDSKKQVEAIFNRYDGYYQTIDKKFSIYLDIKNATEVLLEMSTESSNGTSKANVEGVWNGKEQSYSFTDTFGNSGKVSIMLKNEGISIVVQMENTGDFASIGNQNVEFSLSEKSDKPAILQVTSELLLSWLKTPTTADDITSLGFELEKDSNSEITAGGGTLSEANLYRIANTDVQILFYAKDLSNQKVLYDYGEGADKQIVCAVFSDAEYLIPDKINNKCQMYIEDDTLFVPGGKSMDIDWGGTDIYIQFATSDDLSSSNETIKSNTKVGAICRKIVGNGFFVRSVLLHKSNQYDATYSYYGPIISEVNDGYIMLEDYRSGRAYKVDNKTYEIVDHMEVFEFYVRSEDYKIYSEPSYESKIIKTLSEGWHYSIETVKNQDGNLWGKVIDTTGWICLTDIPLEN